MDAIRCFWAVCGLVVAIAIGTLLAGCIDEQLHSRTPAGVVDQEIHSDPFHRRVVTTVDSVPAQRQCLDDRGRQGIWSDDQMICYSQTTSGGSMGTGYGTVMPGYGPLGYSTPFGAWKKWLAL